MPHILRLFLTLSPLTMASAVLAAPASFTPELVPETDPQTPETFQVVWDTQPGKTYDLQVSSSMSEWASVDGFPVAAQGGQLSHPIEAPADAQFYRVQEMGPQLFNLAQAPTADRFPMPADLVWPTNVGEADICLWSDDKFCAISLTIDDNLALDWPWWLDMAEQFDLSLTWFLITQNVNGSNANGGTWAGAQALVDAGHSVQSHTVSHDASPTEADYRHEYADSQAAVNANITGQWCGTIAYPGGTGTGPRPDLAKDYYIAGRGVVGTPNRANRTFYMETNSVSGYIRSDYIDSVVYGTSGVSWLGNNAYRRGWLSVHFHGVPASAREQRVAEFEYIDTLRDKIWMGTFYDVARYGQERDTATVSVKSVGADAITFTLEDQMNDSIYNHPLTIKIRVADAWTAVQATQAGQPVEASLVEHQSKRYALVKAVPDHGLVTVTNGSGL